MATTCFKQYDSRWGSKAYAGDTMRNAGCGPSSMASLIYAKDTSINPWKVAQWLTKNGYASNGSGTYWSGIKAGLDHYGLPCQKASSISAAFSKLATGRYCAIILFKAGTQGGVCWTTGGHFVAVRGYKVSGGKHYLLMADPGSRNHDGWYCYESTMSNLVSQMWICQMPLSGTWIKKDDRWWYKHSDGTYTTNDWEKIDGKWYHFDSEGWMQTGWFTDKDGKVYLLDKTNGDMKVGWLEQKEWYYFDKSGALQTGFFNDGKADYYAYKQDDENKMNYVGLMAHDCTIDGKQIGEDGKVK